MKSILIIAMILLFSSFASAYDTINTIPSADSSFINDLQVFLRDEDGDQNYPRFGSSVIKGGYHSSDADLTVEIPAVTAFVDGHYVYQAAHEKTYTASKDTYVFLAQAGSVLVDGSLSFPGASITSFNNLVFAEVTTGTNYVNPSDNYIPLMKVVCDGDNVTSTTDMRSGFAVAEYYSDFATALTDSVNRTLLVTEQQILTANTTIAATNDVVLLGNAKIDMDTYDLTINGGFHAPPLEVIDDSGGGTLSWGTKDRIVYGDWTGDDFVDIYEGGTKIVRLNADYGVTDAVRSSFSVVPTSDQDDMNLNAGSDVAVVWGTETYDVNGDFASNTFTAPVAGKYHFDLLLHLDDMDADFTDFQVKFDFSTRSDVVYNYDPAAHLDADGTQESIAISITVDMAASETVGIDLQATGGADQVDVTTSSVWSGYLVH